MPIGRPRRLNAEKCQEICRLVAAGHSFAAVARAMGCNVKTIRRHADFDPQFQRRLEAAAIVARSSPLQVIRRAAQTNPQAAAWLRERTGQRSPRR
ncbi:hypothetical protein I41_19230 [Lacipirellula limnantheis]|uniref:Resolvase HTH domain-containing protein n=1 Tax=Lacipirellula limnantheis TaxID=2528024 RepID=A0A517TWJ5_9BACT|nr:hypothetical protein I41_19230 [Lacipirellula limnantheis]